MTNDQLEQFAEKLELAAGDVLGILDDLQEALEGFNKRQKASDLGKSYRARIEAVEAAKEALDHAAETLRE